MGLIDLCRSTLFPRHISAQRLQSLVLAVQKRDAIGRQVPNSLSNLPSHISAHIYSDAGPVGPKNGESLPRVEC